MKGRREKIKEEKRPNEKVEDSMKQDDQKAKGETRPKWMKGRSRTNEESKR